MSIGWLQKDGMGSIMGKVVDTAIKVRESEKKAEDTSTRNKALAGLGGTTAPDTTPKRGANPLLGAKSMRMLQSSDDGSMKSASAVSRVTAPGGQVGISNAELSALSIKSGGGSRMMSTRSLAPQGSVAQALVNLASMSSANGQPPQPAEPSTSSNDTAAPVGKLNSRRKFMNAINIVRSSSAQGSEGPSVEAVEAALTEHALSASTRRPERAERISIASIDENSELNNANDHETTVGASAKVKFAQENAARRSSGGTYRFHCFETSVLD